MKKHITVAAAEALAAKGWEVVEITKLGRSVSVAYNHPEKEGRVTVWSGTPAEDIITYVNVEGMPDGYYDLNTCEYVDGEEVITW